MATMRICLHSEESTLPEGQNLSTKGPTGARLSTGVDGPAVDIALPPLSRADCRWFVDQILRKVQDLGEVTKAELTTRGDVAADTLKTIALDLHHSFKGELEVSDAVSAEVARIGGLEDYFRGWVNEDPSTRTSVAIARDVEAWGKTQDTVSTEVYDEEPLRELGLRLLLAVGQASPSSPPRLVIAHHNPPGAKGSPLMLLGKGVTFDTGGINVKPYESFVSHMKNDMGGAAIAFSLFKGLVENGHDQPLLCVLPTCENAVGENAMRPGAIVKSYRGHDVRIDHTDAEGRLILADGLAYASEKYQPHQVVCFATLTTAALIAYGPYATPVHFAEGKWREELQAASEATGEDLHFFEERLWHWDNNRDKEADIRNTARFPGDAGKGAGSRNAAHFLKYFTDAPLVHFDIFGSTWNWAGQAPGAGYGATGAPLRTMLRALSNLK